MSNLATRIVSGLVMIAVALGAAVLGGYFFAVLVAAAAAMIFVEWTRMVRGWGLGWQLSGFAYALVPALALLWIRERAPHDLMLLLWVFIVTWSTDIGAYFAGRAIGGPKLAPVISPNKTWAGLIGGMIAAGVLGGLWANFTGLSPALLWLAPLFAVGAQGGDLLESGLKRRAGVKDSGTILPGHGGIMDRLDGLVVVASLTALVVAAGWL
ncbi:phosphatidate cytidylyltransferase [Sphingomonas sp.]|uniref:phosphatidate cytidylyltransferase n=1 Tax=Sphingomonas sp. TaxID=28214 RepID=UPI00286C7B1B|nr:phosphatidate cytidylyltransferase [Sphingomonas sp.]